MVILFVNSLKPNYLSEIRILNNKIKKLNELKKTLSALKKKRKKIVFTNGCFDLLHYGHIKYLETAKKLGDYLVVGLNSDISVRVIKGNKRPIMSQNDRVRILSALACIDFIIIFSEPNPLKLIKLLKPDVLVKGGDWKKKDIIGRDFVKSYNGKVKSIPFIKNYSTSSIIRLIIQKNARAN